MVEPRPPLPYHAAPIETAAQPLADSRAIDWTVVIAAFVLCLVVGVVMFATVRSPMKDDVAWLLHVAQGWLRGERLYTDLLEVNPPLIIWLSAIPVALADLTGSSPKLFAIGLTAGAILGSAWWSSRLLSRYGVLFERPEPLFVVIAVVLFVLPGVEFGQREHLLVAAALPYVGIIALRLRAGAVPLPTAITVGLLAGVGCALKPRYALAFALLEIIAARRKLRHGRPELVAFIACFAAYGAAVFVLYPEYLQSMVPLALSLYDATDVPLARLLAQSEPLLLGEVILLVLWIARSRSHDDPLLLTLVVFGCGATATFLLQGKDWFYHRIPATTVVVLALAYCTSQSWRPGGRKSWALATCLPAVCALFLFSHAAMARLAPRLSEALAPGNTTEAKIERLLRHDHAHSYMAFSQSLSVAFPVVDEAGVVWSSRFDSMWPLSAQLARMREDRGRWSAQWPVRQWVVSDFLAHCPDVVLVDGDDKVDYPKILEDFSGSFRRAWANYAMRQVFGKLQIFEKKSGAVCTAPPL